MNLVPVTKLQFATLISSIIQFRKTFSLPINELPKPVLGSSIHSDGLPVQNRELHDSLHLEEFKELAQAETLVDQLDAIGDMVYVIVGRMAEAGVTNLHEAQQWFHAECNWLNYLFSMGDDLVGAEGSTLWAFDLIHASNMTKTATLEQIEENLEHYETTGIVLNVEKQGEDIYVLKTAMDYPEKNLKKGKVIKNIHYKAVDLIPVIDGACGEK